MPKVTVTASPRQGFRGFGAIERYFLSEQPETIEVTDAEIAELKADPAKYFLKIEDAPASAKAEQTPKAKAEAEAKAKAEADAAAAAKAAKK
jgi:hypothetical protein